MSMDTEDIAVPKPDSPADRLQDQECSEPLLSQQLSTTESCGSWTPSFTDCLVSPSIGSHGPCCDDDENGHDHGTFILLDHLMESDPSETETTSRFCKDLLRELNPFLDKLRPARTQGDHRADEILNLLQSMGTEFKSPEGKSEQQPTQQSTLEHTTGDRVRGDKSIFISREYRQKKSFGKDHPCLDKLIRRTSETFDREFGSSKDENDNKGFPMCDDTSSKSSNIELDFSMTSVQLALYPGDSKSGYRRHCDRQHSCRQETRESGIEIETGTPGIARKMYAPSNNTKPERLITCIYYLTDEDWDASLDGGALRLFRPCDGDGEHMDSSTPANRENQLSPSYIDVVPYRDRMVVFRSDRVEHQVMPSHRRPRLAITMWFYGIVPKQSLASGIPSGAASDVDTSDVMRKPITTTSQGSHPILPLPINRVSVSSTNDDQSPSIFVSLASFRDSETRPTIDAMYSTALNPQRIFTGVVAQLMEGENDDEDIWRSITGTQDGLRSTWTPRPHQLRAMRLHARDATGPCYARGLCQSLYRGEDYVLQIDSHMRFRPNWDEYLIQTIQGLQDRRRRNSSNNEIDHCEKIMLTAYPVGYTLPNSIPNEIRGTYLVPWKFDAQGMLRQRGRLVGRRKSSGPATHTERQHPGEECDSSAREPSIMDASFSSSVIHAHRQYLYAGGFNFAPSRVVFDVPYDTLGLHHLFFGEELSMAVRLFTHGYDIYAPEETVCYHLWSRSHRPTNPSAMSTATATATTRDERKEKLRELSRAKVKKQLLGDEVMIGVYCGLGNVRKAAAFAKHLGVDFERQEFVGEGWDCGELKSNDFVGNSNSNRDDGNESLFPADSVEAKVASLDSKAQSLIGMFLQGLQN